MILARPKGRDSIARPFGASPIDVWTRPLGRDWTELYLSVVPKRSLFCLCSISFNPANPANPRRPSPQAQPYRLPLLAAAEEALRSFGFTIVDDEDDAAWVVIVNDGILDDDILISFNFLATTKLARHRFVASLNDPTFPLPPSISISFDVLFRNGTRLTSSFARSSAANFVRAAWTQSSETIVSICDLSQQLITYGVTLEQLREELISDIHRVRTQRRSEQRKRLDLKVEEGDR